MRKLLFLLSLLFVITACNDGDVLDVELDFEDELTLCNLSPNEFLIYKTKSEPFESLSLIFPRNATTNLIFAPATTPYETEFNINNSSVKFNYRTYDGNPQNLLCQLIPDPNTNITNDYFPTSGRVETTTTFYDEDDDNDGVITRFYTVEFELFNINIEVLSADFLDFGTFEYSVDLE